MSATTTARTPVTAFVLAWLRALWPATADGERVGDNEAPPNTAQAYAILYDIDGGSWRPQVDGSFEATFIYQVSSLGLRRDQASTLADLLRDGMLALRGQAGDGWAIALVEPDTSPAAPYEDGRLWRVPDRFRVMVVPA